MGGSSDVSVGIEDLEYMQASNVNVSDFVSVKFSRRNFRIWQQQMLCLMKTRKMDGMLEDNEDTNWKRDKSEKIIKKYQLLLKGWILGSLNEEVLNPDLYESSPKEIWKKLEDSYINNSPWNPKTEIVVSRRLYTDEAEHDNKKLYGAALEGSWWRAKPILKKNKEAATMAISTDNNTMLHIAVREGNNYFVKKLLNFIEKGELIEKVNRYDQTPLHIAAKFGNTGAAKLLVEKRKELLYIKKRDRFVPLRIAFDARQLNTFVYLLEVTKNSDGYLSNLETATYDSWQIGTAVDLLTKAICTKEYDLAKKLIKIFPKYATSHDEVLIALIRNFPSELGFGEALIYPSLKNVYRSLVKRSSSLFYSLEYPYARAESALWSMRKSNIFYSSWWPEIIMILFIPIALLYPIYQLILLLTLVLLFPLFILYFLLWNAFAFGAPPIKRIEKRKKEYKEAEQIARMIYEQHQHSDHGHYQLRRPILEAARVDAYTVFRQFIQSSYDPLAYLTDEGYDIMQLAVINRSNKVYKLLRSSIDTTEYKTELDSDSNNLVHLAGKLPPLVILRCATGAALQLQQEIQWFEELTRYSEHTLLTQRNTNNETPEMVFTREHADLVKEGENWMKTTAESCSITAALIVTIVFAAAITVPGGSNQETGTPLFRKHIAFTIFAISDAISLFTGATSLSVFLSILTTRFAEKDFLVVLPRRLLIGLFLLLLSTTAMMVAFSTILFIVFCDKKRWTLAPIGALACVPIAAIVFLQFPLMFDLFKSTYFPIFGKDKRERSSSKEE